MLLTRNADAFTFACVQLAVGRHEFDWHRAFSLFTNFDELKNDRSESRNVYKASISLHCREDNGSRLLSRMRCTESNRQYAESPRLEGQSTS